jgi:hypothetical protein
MKPRNIFLIAALMLTSLGVNQKNFLMKPELHNLDEYIGVDPKTGLFLTARQALNSDEPVQVGVRGIVVSMGHQTFARFEAITVDPADDSITPELPPGP